MQNSYKPKGWFLRNITKRIQFKPIFCSMVVTSYKPGDDNQVLLKALANYRYIEIFIGFLIKVVITVKLGCNAIQGTSQIVTLYPSDVIREKPTKYKFEKKKSLFT